MLTVAYALGAALPMLLIALGGQRFGRRLRTDAPRVRFASGIVIALVALGIAFNLDSRFQTALPGYTAALQKHIEDTAAARGRWTKISGGKRSILDQATTTTTTPSPRPAPALEPAGDLPHGAAAHRRRRLVQHEAADARRPPREGRAARLLDVLVHQLPAHAAAPGGLVHRLPPRRPRDHRRPHARVRVRARPSNVAAAIKRLGIKYPVVQDNDFATWTNYSNQYWPAEYLIDQQGRIRAYDFGEGDYAEMEQNIRELLGVQQRRPPRCPTSTPTEQTTPESYLGYVRLDPTRYVGSIIAKDKPKTYPGASRSRSTRSPTAATGASQKNARSPARTPSLTLHFQAEDVYLVLGGHGKVRSRSRASRRRRRRRLVQALHAAQRLEADARPG